MQYFKWPLKTKNVRLESGSAFLLINQFWHTRNACRCPSWFYTSDPWPTIGKERHSLFRQCNAVKRNPLSFPTRMSAKWNHRLSWSAHQPVKINNKTIQTIYIVCAQKSKAKENPFFFVRICLCWSLACSPLQMWLNNIEREKTTIVSILELNLIMWLSHHSPIAGMRNGFRVTASGRRDNGFNNRAITTHGAMQ